MQDVYSRGRYSRVFKNALPCLGAPQPFMFIWVGSFVFGQKKYDLYKSLIMTTVIAMICHRLYSTRAVHFLQNGSVMGNILYPIRVDTSEMKLIGR